MKKEFTPLYLKTFLEEKPQRLKVQSLLGEYNFNLYFVYDEQIPTGRVAIFRTIGMKIEDFKVKNNVRKPFNAVLIGGLKEDAYLKSLENESHTKIEKDQINDEKLKRDATSFINRLSAEIASIIEEEARRQNPVDGKIDTSDVLYVMQTEFKKELKKSMSQIKISKDRTLVKSPGKKRMKERRDRRNEKTAGKFKGRRTQERNPLKWQKSASEANHEGKQVYKTKEEAVQRLVLNDYEIVKFDFKESKDLENVSSCNIKLSIIDGMGKEYKNEMDLKNHYEVIYDAYTGKKYNFSKNKISDVSINKGNINLKLRLKHSANKTLKYIYYVEV